MASIFELGARRRFISFRTDKGLAWKSRRDARRLYRLHNQILKLEELEQKDLEKGESKDLNNHINKVRTNLEKELHFSLDIIKRQHVLIKREMDDVVEEISKTKDNNIKLKLKDQLKVLNVNTRNEINELVRLEKGDKPVVFKGFGTDDSAIFKALKSDAYKERRDIIKRKKAKREEVINGFIQEQNDLRLILRDDFIALYYIYRIIFDQIQRINEYIKSGFSKTDGESLISTFHVLEKAYKLGIRDVHGKALNLFNLEQRRL